ncbi:MAG: hypothetical protein JWO82_1621, partial [Akkermansiaceae bacterium]|nr:hypothetical protein [Akkermansiaceae bacterium]
MVSAWILGMIAWLFVWPPSAGDSWFSPGEFTGDELPFHLASYALIVCLVYGAYRVLLTPGRSDRGHWMTVISVPPMLLLLSDVRLLGSKGSQLYVWAGFAIL